MVTVASESFAVAVVRMPRGVGARIGVKLTFSSSEYGEKFCSISAVWRCRPAVLYAFRLPMTSEPSIGTAAFLPAPEVPVMDTTARSGSMSPAPRAGWMAMVAPVGKHPGTATRVDPAIFSRWPGISGMP